MKRNNILMILTSLFLANVVSSNITVVNANDELLSIEQQINELINTFYNNGTYIKKSNIFLSSQALEEVRMLNGFHGSDILNRTTYYTEEALWMSKENNTYSYYGTDEDGNLTYGTSDEPFVDPSNITVAALYEQRESNPNWKDKSLKGMEGYYYTLKDVIVNSSHNFEVVDGVFTSSNEEVIEWFKAIVAPCYIGFTPTTYNYITLDKVEIEQVGNNLKLRLYAVTNEGMLTNNDNIFAEATFSRFDRNVDFSTLNYVAFGDSITYGSEWCNGYKQMQTPYPKEVARILNLKSVSNKGVSGACYSKHDGYYSISPTIIDYKGDADIISVMLGINDFTRHLPLGNLDDNDLSTICGAINLTMSSLKENNPNAYIFYMTPYKIDSSAYHWDKPTHLGYYLVDICDAIKQLAYKYDIDVLDMFEYGNFELEMNDSDSDGIHPNQDFILEYTSPQIAKFIQNNYRK